MVVGLKVPQYTPGGVAQSVGHLTHKSGVLGLIPGLATYIRFSFRFSRRAVVSYWRKYVHEVLVNRLGGLSLPRKSVVRLTGRPDMTLVCWNNIELLLLMKYMRAIQIRTSTIKTRSFLTDHLEKLCKLRSACSIGISLIRVYTVAIPSAYCCKTTIPGQ